MPATSTPPRRPVPERFRTQRATLFLDRFMTGFIRIGGVLVIAAVIGIFFFILLQIFPLFQSARVEEAGSVALPDGAFVELGVDEWGQLPFLVDTSGRVITVDVLTGTVEERKLPFTEAVDVTAVSYNQREERLIVGTDDGRFAFVDFDYRSRGLDEDQQVTLEMGAQPLLAIGSPGLPVQRIAFGKARETQLVAAIQQVEGQSQLHALTIRTKRTLLGSGEPEIDQTFELSHLLTGRPVDILLPTTADAIIVLTAEGEVNYLFLTDAGEFELRQNFVPFEDAPDPTVTAMGFLLGDVSIAFGNVEGLNRAFSLYIPEGRSERVYGFRHEFPRLPEAPTFVESSLRNKAFLIGGGETASLRYLTTDVVRWENARLGFNPRLAVVNGKYNGFFLLDTENRLHRFGLDDPHPEAGWRAFFSKLYYEGSAEKKWEWQSTGGSDDFEPKLSLVPLIFGTLKGTFYAMLFAVPIAIAAALYTSQFMDPGFRNVIKPTMEIMASLPSVVLGFLAALYIAPLIERQVPSLLLVAAGVPIASMLIGWVWSNLPIRFRNYVQPGFEGLFFVPVLLLLIYGFWELGPAFERLAFVTTDPVTGNRIADFRYWWPEVTGTSFEQRNSLVVGFMMGFAVIPIIFTITDDALSNVPLAMRSASLACGASRWQTAMMVVLPTASAGIFSAVMIGLGRAVGETMIVVMATGNTPIMEWNIFSGMRTLSANIAVELPEAPQFSTLYRTLFLGAMVLFVLTFFINTIAEILRQHLREKYKTI